ncbi:hypothetical protein CHS0354_011906 [Potamilus streckersoni]|uniref:Uncharacterized protein n=1 Tax=Potamilus streckersoni TaxID=2493646 RepID=A0AAE0T0T6_9BIVA|nr:hypothetical protein CHS0354_011906 [Potamilus streckersoni]
MVLSESNIPTLNDSVAYSFIHLPTVVILSQYFKKRRGLANSISVSGTSMGGLVLAPVVTAMFEYYGYSGTFLIVSGIVLHCWVAAALFRPLEFYKIKSRITSEELTPLTNNFKPTVSDSEPAMKGVKNPGEIIGRKVNDLQTNRSNSPMLQQQLVTAEETISQGSDIKHKAVFLRGKGDTTITEPSITGSISRVLESDVAPLSRSENLNVSTWIENRLKEVIDDKATKNELNRNYCFSASAIVRSFQRIFDLELMKNPLFWTLLFQAALTCSGLAFMSVFLAPRAREIGLDETQIGLLYSIMNIIDLLCLIIIGFISDLKFIRRSTLIAIASLVDGILANCISLFTTFPSFTICVCIHGVVGGMYFALFAVNLVDYLGMEKLGSCLGFTNLIHGVSIAVLFTTLGKWTIHGLGASLT